jgi:hypothetical protein
MKKLKNEALEMSAAEMSEICGGRPPIPPKDIIDTVPHPLDNMGYWKMINGLYVWISGPKDSDLPDSF